MMGLAPVSDEEFSTLGRWVVEHYRKPMSVEDDSGMVRPMTGLEMAASHAAMRALAIERRDRDGCCQAGPDAEGRCYGCGGYCPQVEEARQAEAFCLAFLKWLEPKEGGDDDDCND